MEGAEAFCIEASTYATKAMKLLRAYGIPTRMKRSDCGGGGCAYEISVPYRYAETADAALYKAGIPIKGRRREE